MNLFDMLRRKDKNLVVTGPVAMAKQDVAGQVWRGLSLGSGASLRIPDVRRLAGLRAFPADCGWMVQAPAEMLVEVSFRAPGKGDEVVGQGICHGEWQSLVLPWPKHRAGHVDLVVEVIGRGGARVFLAAHRALSRQWLLDSAVGCGVEIGPGAQPQVLPREGVNVSYLEQMPPDVWNRLYNVGGKYETRPELWENYIVGDAHELPVEDNSLDFLFGSHVFEHLANPIGHLRRWKAKLRNGGKVICVVPDLNGTKDAVQARSTLADWLEEDRDDVWSPLLHHYVRYLRRTPDDEHLIAAIERKESIHVHFYDNINCQVLLEYAVVHLGYSDFLIEHTPNHKDFHFVLFN